MHGTTRRHIDVVMHNVVATENERVFVTSCGAGEDQTLL